jgi:ATP-dependent exoDNAse (exonuclease V) alpha subunit
LAQTTEEDVETLRSRLLERHPDVDTNQLVKLCSYKRDAERLNQEALAKLDTPVQRYSAEALVYDDKGKGRAATAEERAKDTYTVEAELALKVGARVLLCHNLDFARGLYNGARGTVVDFRRAPLQPAEDPKLYPQVEFEGRGGSVLVEPHKWECKEAGRLVSSFTQVPLLLCYAVTVHKAQGLTLPSVLATMNFFECGQCYVALSRTRRLQDLYLTNVDMAKLLTHDAAVTFYTENKLI